MRAAQLGIRAVGEPPVLWLVVAETVARLYIVVCAVIILSRREQFVDIVRFYGGADR
jgi:hypothetical protein